MSVKEGLTVFTPVPGAGFPYPKPIKVKDAFDFHMYKLDMLLGTMRKTAELMVTTKRAYDRANNDEIKEVIRQTVRLNLEALSKLYIELGDLVKGLTG